MIKRSAQAFGGLVRLEKYLRPAPFSLRMGLDQSDWVHSSRSGTLDQNQAAEKQTKAVVHLTKKPTSVENLQVIY